MDRDIAMNKPEDPSSKALHFGGRLVFKYNTPRGIPIDMSHTKKSEHYRESSVVGSEGRIT